jgi:hypothetical protein
MRRMGDSSINFTQGASVGGPGYALMGVLTTPVVVSNGDDSAIVSWRFEVLDVGYGSTVPQGIVQSGSAPTWTFAPDVRGGYLVRLTTEDEEGNLYVDERVFGVPEANGLFIPPFSADSGSMNFVVGGSPNQKGWSPYANAWLRLLEAGVPPGPVAPQWITAASSSKTIAFVGSPQAVVIDTSLGTVAAVIAPSSMTNGQVLIVHDAVPATGLGGWSAIAGKLTLPVGMKIEDPLTHDPFVSSGGNQTYTFPPGYPSGMAGSTLTYQYLAVPNMLKLVS